MTLKSIGELKQDKSFEELFSSSEIKVPYFNDREMVFEIEGIDENSLGSFDKAIENFLNLTQEEKQKANEHIYKYYQFVKNLVDDDYFDFEIENEKEVWEYVDPQVIIASQRDKDGKIYVSVITGCDWDPEHGMQIVYKEGKTLQRVSSCDGHVTHTDAYALDESEDKISDFD